MKEFVSFVESLGLDPFTRSAVLEAYHALTEAVPITKEYLLTEAGSIQQAQIAKTAVDALGSHDHMDQFVPQSVSQKIKNNLYLQEIRKSGSIDKDVLHVLHDLSSAKKLNILDKLNSDYTPVMFEEFIDNAKRSLKATGVLSDEEEKTWLRVKVFHDFEIGRAHV